MVSNWVNIARALKGLYDLSFSQEPFYINTRAELRNGLRYSITQFQTGLNEAAVKEPPRIRKPFKIMLCILVMVFLLAAMFGGR